MTTIKRIPIRAVPSQTIKLPAGSVVLSVHWMAWRSKIKGGDPWDREHADEKIAAYKDGWCVGNDMQLCLFVIDPGPVASQGEEAEYEVTLLVEDAEFKPGYGKLLQKQFVGMVTLPYDKQHLSAVFVDLIEPPEGEGK